MQDNKIKNILLASSISITILIMVVMGSIFLGNINEQKTLLSGTKINNINVGDMEYDDAFTTLQEGISTIADNFQLTLRHQDQTWTFDKDDFVVNSDIYSILEEAQVRARINNDYQKQLESLEMLKQDGNNLTVAFNYLFVGLDSKIDKICEDINKEAIDSTITINNDVEGLFVITPATYGIKVDKEALYNNINDCFTKSHSIDVSIPTYDVPPTITEEYNQSLTHLKSKYSTNVSDSTGNRKFNVKKALAMLDGCKLMPKESLSFNKITGPHTSSNGYKVATIIYDGKFTDGVGGGICQASSTLYNALLLSGIQIDEVNKHTLPVKYVPLGQDAMVAEGISDLKFTNNLDSPILIHTYSNSDSVTVEIYGQSLEDTTYKVKSNIIKELQADDVTKIDYSKEYADKVLYQGEKYRVNYPKNGYEISVILEKYIGDDLVHTEEIRHETYKPNNGLIIEGAEALYSGYFE